MPEQKRKRRLHELLHRANVLPDGNLDSISTIDVVKLRLENPQEEDSENKESSL